MAAKPKSNRSSRPGGDRWAWVKHLTDLAERASKRVFGLPIPPGQKFAFVIFFPMLFVAGIFAWRSSGNSPGCVLAAFLCLMGFAVWIISEVKLV